MSCDLQNMKGDVTNGPSKITVLKNFLSIFQDLDYNVDLCMSNKWASSQDLKSGLPKCAIELAQMSNL